MSRIRKALNLTQLELGDPAGIHSRSLGKIERGLTVKINRKTLHGLAHPLAVPQEYLSAVNNGEEVNQVDRVKFCYLCGAQLRATCTNCAELVVSLKYKFFSMCGKPYKPDSQNT